MITAKVVADSVNPFGNRITSFELTYPLPFHAELMTHKMFSRSAASSRAIPIEKMLKAVEENPYIPEVWGSNQKGMQAGAPLDAETSRAARATWLTARDYALACTRLLSAKGVHKQWANRLLAPFAHITVLVTATNYANFYALRDSELAMPEMQQLAKAMRVAHVNSNPRHLEVGEWHLPYVTDEDISQIASQNERHLLPLGYVAVSVGRCARLSYLTHDGKRDWEADIDLHDRLRSAGHWSPFEHVAQALPGPYRSGNFVGWHQYRKSFPNEYVKEAGE